MSVLMQYLYLTLYIPEKRQLRCSSQANCNPNVHSKEALASNKYEFAIWLLIGDCYGTSSNLRKLISILTTKRNTM